MLIQGPNGQPVEVSTTNPLPVGTPPAQTLLGLPSTAQTASNTGITFSTLTVAAIALDITVTALTGGTAPTITFFLDRLGADGVWYREETSAAVSAPGTVSAILGPFAASAGVFSSVWTTQARFGWTFGGSVAPTSVTFSASIVGR